jgi:hypothetical protein
MQRLNDRFRAVTGSTRPLNWASASRRFRSSTDVPIESPESILSFLDTNDYKSNPWLFIFPDHMKDAPQRKKTIAVLDEAVDSY